MRKFSRVAFAAAAVVLTFGWDPAVQAACGVQNACDSNSICVVSAGDACVSDTVRRADNAGDKAPHGKYECLEKHFGRGDC